MDRFTQLPPFPSDETQTTSISWQLNVTILPVQVPVLSWAMLLYSFTSNETPVFTLNGQPVKADLSARTVHPVALDTGLDVSESYTAVVIEDEISPTPQERPQSSGLCVLSLTLDSQTGTGALHSSTGIDPVFLQQIERQLKQFIHRQAKLNGLQVKLSSVETPELSISNPSPWTLPGPNHLHELALRGLGKSNDLALEFLAADGTVHSLTYRSMDELSTNLAAHITIALGPLQVDPTQSVVIPVLLPQSVDFYITCIAILKAGAAFCPLNIDTPPDRIEFILQDVAAPIVVTQQSLATKVPNGDGRLILITTDELETQDHPDSLPPTRESNPLHLAYVMYTSGSTGRPKGVGISHLAVTQSLLAHDELIPPFTRFLQFASPTFDVSVFEYFFPLMRGATIIGCDRETMVRDISYVLRRMNVDGAELTPTVAGELLRKRTVALSLRVLLTIGEMLTRRVVDEFAQSATSDGILHGMYGPTEAAIHCTAAPAFQAKSRVNLIGQPLKTVSAFVISLQPEDNTPGQEPCILPFGQIGELVVGGSQLADGYINRPEENAKAFIESPSYGRLYRTGDKARMLPNGELECFGRIASGQVKLRGQRIELGEIEHAVSMIPNVRGTVATVASGLLIAFVVANDQGTTDDELRQACRRWLPRFMVPGEFVLVDNFPTLPSGKIDRKLLEFEYLQRRQAAQGNGVQAFRDETEEAISLCVTKTLEASVPVTDSLAAAGLDSLAAIRLASHLRGVGFNLEVGGILEADSVDRIWNLVKTTKPSQPGQELQNNLESIWQQVVSASVTRLRAIGIESDIDDVGPCSHIQQAMIAETVRNPMAYCNWIELEFYPPMDVATVKKAFCKVAQHNDLLRSGFLEIGIKDHSYSRFAWKELKDQIFRESKQFAYDLHLSDEHGILYPMRIQYRQEEAKLHVLVHIHHALYDGWSWELILEDFQTVMAGHSLPQRPPYKSVIRFLTESQILGSMSESSTYWQDQLYGMSAAAWPNLNPKTDVASGREQVTRVLGVSTSNLNQVSQHLCTSRQAIFQAAFSYLLSVYLGTGDVVFGTVFSGRTLPIPGIESIIGPCIGVLPTRMKLNKVQNMADLVLAIHNTNRKSLEHGTLPLQDIKKASGIDLNLRMFDSAMVWQETIWSGQQRDTPFNEVAAADFLEFAMLLELEPKDDAVQAKVTYQRSILPSAQMEIFLEQLEHVTSGLLDSLDLPTTGILDHLPPSNLSIENQHFESQTNLPSLASGVEDVASTDPDRAAIEFLHSQDVESGVMRKETLTYQQLNDKANRLAHHLIYFGVQQGDFIGILLDKSMELYVSILAVLKIGAGYIPLRPDMPTQRVHYILSESQPHICITSSLVEQEHELGTLEFLRPVDVVNGFPEEYSESNIFTTIDGSNVAYAIFTSGSTGTPKGVLVTHHNMQSNIAVLTELYPTQKGSKMLQACSHSFDVSVFEILFAWQTGMTLCATTNDILFRDIQNVIRGLGITHLSLTPTVAGLISAREVPDVQFLVTSGESLTAKVHQDWSGKGLYQGYGPCETTNICTVSCDTGLSTPLRNIGPPLKNTSAFVMFNEDDCRLSPRGAAGEFCFGGDQVARGYLNRPDLTAAKFIDHPQYGRIYRSGDYGRLLVDGSLCYNGRRDDQVKLRGQRIELREINSVLLQTEMVHDCASIILEVGARKQQQLLSFWVPSPSIAAEAQQSVRDLFEKLAAALPAYMVPSLLIPFDTLPMTENGKTDHRILRRRVEELSLDETQKYSLNLGDADDDGDFSDLERTVATALSEVTGVDLDDIHRHTSFYNVGLDSISAISFSRKLRDSGLGQLNVSAILRHSSVARLSTVISSGFDPRVPEEPLSTGIENVFSDEFSLHIQEEFSGFGKTVQSIYPCTPLQEAMLSAEVSKSDSGYFNHLLFQLNGELDRYRETWEVMLKRHAILRTFFRSTNDAQYAYAQVAVEDVSLPWYSVDASANDLSYSVEKQKFKLEEQFGASDVLPYSLAVFRDNTAGKSFLLLSMHHALYDGEAMVQLLHETQLLLSSQPLPEVVQFERFIGYMLRMDTDESDKYWDQYLSDVSPSLLSSLKTDKEAASGRASHESRIELAVSYDAFKDMCKEASVAPLNLFHAAWARLLSIYTETSDICFGNVFSGRTIPLEGADRVVGPCFNTLPIRIRFPSAATNEDIMKATQRNNSNILPHQLSSLRRIQRRNLGDGSPLFDTLVILQTRRPELDNSLWELISEQGSMDFPFICEITPDGKTNKVQIRLHSQESCISAEDAGLVVQQFAALIDHTIRYPSAQALDKRPVGEKMPFLPRKVTERSRKLESLAPVGPQTSHPWTSYEEEVQDILCKFSKADKTTVLQGTSIFQLGLDSINAVQIAASLGERGYSVSASSILEATTVSGVAALLSPRSQNSSDVNFDFSSFESQHLYSACEQLQIPQDTVESLRPCTPVQNGMLAMFSNSNGDVYFNEMTLKSPKPLDKALLQEAWIKVMRKHEILRTGFVQLKDQQHPFAMITYHEGVASLPWDEVMDPTSNNISSQTQKVLEKLHQPPWFLAIESSNTMTTVRFSALHAIYDAQALHLIFADVAAAYRGEAIGDAASINSTLGPILIESTTRSDESQGFWTEIGKEIQPVKFPDLHPSRVQEKKLLTSSLSCSKPRQNLEEACQKLGMTLQAAGQAAWARLISAYTGEPSVIFGVVLSGRNLSAAAQDAVFPCLVTMPSPCRVAGTNREVLDSVLKRNVSLMEHQFTPLSKIQRWLKSDEGLFDTLFVYQKFASQKQDAEAWDVIDEDARIDYPVSIELVPHSNELEFRLTHRGDVVPQKQAMTILEQFDRLLTNSIFSPDSSSDDYSFLGNRLLSVTPAEQKLVPSSVSLLHQFVEQNAARIPSKPAFEFASKISDDDLQKETWTYSEFNNDGNKIARLLQVKGAMPGSLIAICFDKCPEASLGILGVLKAGCAYVALDPNAPMARKQFILEDSASKLLLCTSAGKPELEKLSGVELSALDEPGVLDGISSAAPTLARSTRPDDTCYCLYTSGTTGTPKGCEITHENAVQAMLAFQTLFEPHWDEESRWLQFASFHFDVSVLEQYWSWSVGICVTSCPRDLLFEDLPGTIRRLGITHIDLTPSLARLVLPEDVPSLCRGVFITGGEQLKQEILDAWGHHGVIYNGYGPTEVTIGCTMLPRVPANGKPTNIGPQFVNVGSYVMIPGTTTPVIRGGVGELCVSGALVGRGYLYRPELTEERFQSLKEQGDRMYRTGDLVRILHDGSFQFLGRMDDQVKLRGQRLEIGEINEVIRHATPELNEVTTLVIKHPKQSKEQLVSFVTKKITDQKPRSVEVRFSEDNDVFLSEIKSACQERLPGYMVPTHIIPITLFPLSANNKVDAKALKNIYGELSLDDIQKLTSMSVKKFGDSEDQQRTIASLLSKFIGSLENEVSPWQSIYELGLDSISVISFSRFLRDAGFAQAQPSLIMKNPTISGMAAALVSTAPSNARMSLCRNARQNIEAFAHRHLHSILENIRVSHKDVEGLAPCTPLQEGIIYHFLNSDKALYCSSFNFELNHSVDVSRLGNAWSQTKNEVQMLRARLSPTPDGYAQVILKDCPLVLSWTFVSSEKGIEDVQKSQFKSWFDGLSEFSGNLWEVSLVQSPSKSVMCLNIFHALYDGNSLSLLLEKVAMKYLEEDRAVESPSSFLDTLPVGPLCKDPSAQQFWAEHLKDPHDKLLPKSNAPEHSAIVKRVDINAIEHVDKVRKFLNVTEQAVLHACWLVTIHHRFGFVPPLGIVVSGRALDIPGIESVIGPLFNTIPSNVNFRGLKTWSDIVQRCHDYHTSSLTFQHTPLRDIMKWTRRTPSKPLFDSLFVFQRGGNDGELVSEKLWRPLDSESDYEYPLAFEVTRNGNKSLTVTLAAQDHVMSSETAQDILSSFEQHICTLSQNPATQLPQMDESLPNGAAHVKGEDVEKGTQHDVSKMNGRNSFQWTTQADSIRNVIADLAGVEKESVDADTSIFELGLDSIDAIKLSSRLSKLGIRLAVSVIMRWRTIREMTEQITSSLDTGRNNQRVLLSQLENSFTKFLGSETRLPADSSRILPATPIQEAMVAEMVASNYAHYYNHDVLELEPSVDISRLRDAWQTVVKAHPILRTSFVEVWDPKIPVSYAQVVHDQDAMDFHIVDLQGKSVDTIIEHQRSRAASYLVNHPLLTVTVAMDGDKRYLILSMAHSLYDGWSINLLHEDVARCYAGEECQRPLYDEILESIIASSGDSASKFWRTTLENSVPTAFPKGQHAGKDQQVVHRGEKMFTVSSSKLDDFCKSHGITMQALSVTCWASVLAGVVEELDVVFGLVLSGRNMVDSEDVMFPTMNTVAMRAILHGSRMEMVRYVQEALVDMSEYQHFPLRKARPDIGTRQLFDTLFIYQKRPEDDTTRFPALYNSTGGSSAIDYPVCVEIENVAESVVCRVACQDNVMGASDTSDLLERIEQTLQSIVQEPDEQTIEFIDGGMRVCGSQVFQDSSSNGEAGVYDKPSRQRATEWSDLEVRIRDALSIVSGIAEDQIDKEATLFQLGLDSISAIKVASLLKKRAIRLTVSDMLKAGDIEQMAQIVNQKHVELTSNDLLAALDRSREGIDTEALLRSNGIERDQMEKVFPVTPGQCYFLAMNSLNPEAFYPSFYHLANRRLSQDVVNYAWEGVTAQLPMLRTAFVRSSHKHVPYVQAVMKTAHNPVIWHKDLLQRQNWGKARKDVSKIPAALHACQTDKGTVLALQIHHALYDAVSLPRIIDILATFCNGEDASTTAMNADLSRFVAYQCISSPVDARRQFWETYLGKNDEEASASDQNASFGCIESYYRPGLVANMSKIEAIAKHDNLSVQSIILAVYARVHGRIVDGSKGRQVIGLYLANRSHGMEGLIDFAAPTLNIVALRIDDKHGGVSLLAAAGKIQDELNEISRIEHAGVSLQEIAEWTGVRLDTCFNFMRSPEMADNHDANVNGNQSTQLAPADARDLEELAGPSINGAEANGSAIVDQTTPNGVHRDEVGADTDEFLNVFKPTLDVEAAIRNDRLDFGVFGPQDRVGVELGEGVIEELRREMMALMNGV